MCVTQMVPLTARAHLDLPVSEQLELDLKLVLPRLHVDRVEQHGSRIFITLSRCGCVRVALS